MLKVIVVDDDKMVCQCLKTMIDWTTLEYEFVGEAYDGQQGYDMIKEYKVDVIITDLKMPVMDGLTLCKKIRQELEGVTIIFLSAYEDFCAAQLGMKYGVRNYILKPIDEDKLNEITKVLTEINERYVNEQYCHYLLSDKEFEEDIYNNLKAGNEAFFDTLFTELESMFMGESSLLQVVCLKMINVLYEYLKKLGFNERVVEAKQSTINERVHELGGAEKIIDFAQNMYRNILYLIPGDPALSNNRLIENIKNYIHQNYSNQQLYYPMIATRFNISQQYMRKIFKQNVGMTLNEYISSVRLSKAAELLENSDATVADIAGMTGFVYPHYFARSFKNKYGISPNEHRGKALKKKKRGGV